MTGCLISPEFYILQLGDYFTSHLPDRFIGCPEVVKEAIMTDANDLVQEFWRTSTDRTDGESLFANATTLSSFVLRNLDGERRQNRKL